MLRHVPCGIAEVADQARPGLPARFRPDAAKSRRRRADRARCPKPTTARMSDPHDGGTTDNVERIVRRLAHHRIGRGDCDAAFEVHELTHLRRFLAFANAAECRVIGALRQRP